MPSGERAANAANPGIDAPAASGSLFDDVSDAPSTVLPAEQPDDVLRLARRLPASIYLGTSSWSFPGWRGIVYAGDYSEAQLARDGLAAYAAHPLLRTVSIDRGFYQPLTESAFAAYAAQVGQGDQGSQGDESFRFVVKAPSLLTDAVLRGERGAALEPNARFLDPHFATEAFVEPAMRGLGARAGVLVYQLPPLPADAVRGDAGRRTIERLGAMLAALPQQVGNVTAVHAVEVRNAELLTPRLMRTLREVGARLVIAVHPRMPPVARQARALRAMDAPPEEGDDWRLKGPLVVRWNLHAGLRYDDAKQRYAPFDRLIDPDLVTRGALAHLVHVAIRSDQPSFVIANNKAEGSAPLTLLELARAVID